MTHRENPQKKRKRVVKDLLYRVLNVLNESKTPSTTVYVVGHSQYAHLMHSTHHVYSTISHMLSNETRKIKFVDALPETLAAVPDDGHSVFVVMDYSDEVGAHNIAMRAIRNKRRSCATDADHERHTKTIGVMRDKKHTLMLKENEEARNVVTRLLSQQLITGAYLSNIIPFWSDTAGHHHHMSSDGREYMRPFAREETAEYDTLCMADEEVSHKRMVILESDERMKQQCLSRKSVDFEASLVTKLSPVCPHKTFHEIADIAAAENFVTVRPRTAIRWGRKRAH